MTTTYTCPVCSKVRPLTEKERISLALYGLCSECYLRGEIKRSEVIDKMSAGAATIRKVRARAQQIMEETKS